MSVGYSDNVEKDLGLYPSKDNALYLYHFYVYTHITDISNLSLFQKEDLLKIFSEKRRYSYHIPKHLFPENLSEPASLISRDAITIRTNVVSELKKIFNPEKKDVCLFDFVNKELFLNDEYTLDANSTQILNTILERFDQTETVRNWFDDYRNRRAGYPEKLYNLECVLYNMESRDKRRYFYVPLIRGINLYGYIVFVFKEIDNGEAVFGEIEKYLKDSMVSKSISFYDRIIKGNYGSSGSLKSWLCESISEVANCYGLIHVKKEEDDIPVFYIPECGGGKDVGKKVESVDFDFCGQSFLLKFELNNLGGEFCGIWKELDRNLKAMPFKFNTFRRAISILKDLLSDRRMRYAYETRSAIGSIMSRNGSHNIGSHVLAALSHNVGTLPDDRVLYQYIQQRMDYIATVTTDFPTWTQPTMFVADMIKTFLSQRHLLDHIVESEGLHAFQFQNPNMTDEEWKAQENCVKIHIRRKKGKKYKELIDYTKRDAKVSLQDGTEECDISLAIPGGIIGEHAFYTILENIIRNAAKHSWATGNNNAKNLDIYIDFTDEDEQVKFKVYAKLEPSKCKKLVDELKKKLSQSFIDEDTGALRRENWGLAEMKISAGYLAGEPIEAIGGVGDKKGTNDIITPYVESSKYLGYEFFIAKPKEILIIVKNEDENKWNDEKGVMKKSGIFVKTIKEAKEELKLNYRYIVHYDATKFFNVKTREPKDGILIPFRMLSGKSVPSKPLQAGKQNDGKEQDWEWLQPFIADLDDGIEKDKKENGNGFEQLKESFENGLVDDVRKIVYKAYYEHLKKARKNKEIKDIGLLVAINENEKSGGNSLISDADILELMMEQNFAVCIDQYDALAQNENSRSTIKLLHLIKNSSNDDKKVVKFKDVQGRTIRELIAQRLYNWIYNNSDINDDEICRHLKQKYYAIEKNESESVKRGNGNSNNDDFERGVNALMSRHPIDDFIRYAESVFENTKKLFKQYEEQIVTLPAGYKINISSEVKQENEGSDKNVALDGVKIVTNIEDIKKEKDRHWIGYRRHAHTIDGCKRLYVEPLSGTQTYLSQLSKVKDDLGLQMRLIENGLMRILVLDERVAKFLREHQKEVGPHYQSMSINVIDHEWVESGSKGKAPIWAYSKFKHKNKNDLKDFVKNKTKKLKALPDVDILIVHQGILDKWFEEFKSDKDKMRKLLEGFKKLVKYVVVTTGRGTPVNIPEEAHLLPFAVVESTLFKKYPEKLILTDTIMNVLPVGAKANEGGE